MLVDLTPARTHGRLLVTCQMCQACACHHGQHQQQLPAHRGPPCATCCEPPARAEIAPRPLPVHGQAHAGTRGSRRWKGAAAQGPGCAAPQPPAVQRGCLLCTTANGLVPRALHIEHCVLWKLLQPQILGRTCWSAFRPQSSIFCSGGYGTCPWNLRISRWPPSPTALVILAC